MDLSALEGTRNPRVFAAAGALVVGSLVLLLIGLVRHPSLFVNNFIGGLVYGVILAMISVGLALILGLLGVVNFAHGALFMLGAYGAYEVVASQGMSYWTALLIVPLVIGVVGVAIEVGVLRHLYGQTPIIGLLATFGVALMLEEVARAQWGATPLSFDVPGVLKGSITIGLVQVTTVRLFTMVVGIVVVVGLYLFIHRTDFGLTIRAGVQNQEMAEFIGVDIPRRFTIVFFIGATLAGLAGVLRGGEVGMDLGMGFEFVLLAFVIVAVGGVGSIFGSVISAILVGLSVFLAPVTLRSLAEVTGIPALNIPGIGGFMPFAVLLAVLLIRPRGLFGEEGLLE